MTSFKVEVERLSAGEWNVRLWGNGLGISICSFSWWQGGERRALQVAAKLRRALDEIIEREGRHP